MGMNVQAVASARSYGTVTKSDTTPLNFNAVYVGGAGDVAIAPDEDAAGGTSTSVTFTAVPAGAILPIQGKRIMSTGTTATAMVWLSW